MHKSRETNFLSDKDKAALGAHSSSKEFKAFQKRMSQEELIGAPTQLKFVKSVGGFVSRL